MIFIFQNAIFSNFHGPFASEVGLSGWWIGQPPSPPLWWFSTSTVAQHLPWRAHLHQLRCCSFWGAAAWNEWQGAFSGLGGEICLNPVSWLLSIQVSKSCHYLRRALSVLGGWEDWSKKPEPCLLSSMPFSLSVCSMNLGPRWWRYYIYIQCISYTCVMQLCDILRKKAANVVSLLEPPFKSVELQSCLAWPQNETSIK